MDAASAAAQARLGGQEGDAWKTGVGRVWAEDAEVLRAGCGAPVERRLRAGPHPAELAQEQLDAHHPPAGQDIQGLAQSGVGEVPPADHGALAVVSLVDNLAELADGAPGQPDVLG